RRLSFEHARLDVFNIEPGKLWQVWQIPHACPDGGNSECYGTVDYAGFGRPYAVAEDGVNYRSDKEPGKHPLRQHPEGATYSEQDAVWTRRKCRGLDQQRQRYRYPRGQPII